MSRLSKEILQRAVRGDKGGLLRLRLAITDLNFTTAALEAPLVHLRLESLNGLPDAETTERAIEALLCLQSAILSCNRALEATIQILLERLGGIASWIDAVLTTAGPRRMSGGGGGLLCKTSTLLTNIMELHHSLESAILSTPRTVDLILRYWCGRFNGQPGVVTGLTTGCPILNLVGKCLESKYNTEFYDRVMSTSKTFDALCAGVIVRFHWLSANCDNLKIFTFPDSSLYLSKLMRRVIINLIRNQAAHNRLHRMRYIAEWCKCLLVVGRQIAAPPLLDAIQGIFYATCAGFSKVNPLKGLVEAYSSGIIRSIIRSLRWFPEFYPGGAASLMSEETVAARKTVLSMFMTIGASSLYPQCSRALVAAFDALPYPAETAIEDDKEIGDLWKELVRIIRMHHSLVASVVPELTYCDNHQDGLQHTIGVPKACSGCQSVYYCSRTCQQADWLSGHRVQCPEMRRSRLVRDYECVQYTWKTRAFHLSYIRTIYEATYVLNIQPDAWDAVCILSIEGGSKDLGFSVTQTDANGYGYAHFGWCTAMGDRAQLMIDHFLSRGECGFRLVDTMLMYGGRYVVWILTEHYRVPASEPGGQDRWPITKYAIRMGLNEG